MSPGNMMHAENAKPESAPAASARQYDEQTTGHDASVPLRIQFSLTVGSPDDPMEHEADETADRVMRMPEPGFIQRKCAACEEEETVQRKPVNSFIQRMPVNGGSAVSNATASKITQSRTGGSPLPGATKSFMESRFGTDFGSVKVHTGGEAASLSKELNAQAFTIGNDIFFGQGKFSPETQDGRRLLAHELTHTLQQSDTIRRTPFGPRPDYASMPIDYDMIADPEERYALMQADYARWRWKDAMTRLENGELEDSDLQYESLRNRLTGLKSSEMSALITKIKAFQAQRDKDVKDPTVKDPDKKRPVSTAKIVEWLEVRQVISTPMPENATVNSLLPGMIDSYTVSFGDVIITVKPDTSGAAGNDTGATSNITGARFRWKTDAKGIITELKKDGSDFDTTKLEVTIATHYKDNPNDPSGYGKGTTVEDKANQTTTLRVHEGQHGTDYIKYLTTKPLPASLTNGIVGHLTDKQFSALMDYAANITKESCETTDQIGFTQDEFLKTAEGKASGIKSCRKP